MTCTHSDGVTICHTPMEVVRRDDAGSRWCFGCRKILPHEATLLRTIEPSYYEPHWELACSGCGKDRTAFPGRT